MYRRIAIFLAGLLLTAGAAGAQDLRPAKSDESTVSVTGRTRLQRRPTLMRVYLQLTAKGKTAEEAMAALKERREAAETQIEKLGANKGSIVCNGPWMDHSSNARQKRMEMMIAQRMGSRGKKPAKTAKPPVVVSSLLMAEWPLEGDTSEKLLLAAELLREKIKAADLGGAKEAEKLSPEEQEAADETAEQMPQMISSSDEETPEPGQPHVLFVAKISPKERQAAVEKAVARAKSEAADLAQAAGADLGRLVSLSASNPQDNFMQYQSGPYGQMGDDNPFSQNGAYLMQRLLHQRAASDDEPTSEATGNSPNAMDFEFLVQATFKLEPRSARP
jgi:hypothetical protein